MKYNIGDLMFILGVLGIAFISGYMGYRYASKFQEKNLRQTVCDTVVYVDTISYFNPVPSDSQEIKFITRVLPAANIPTAEVMASDTSGIGDSTAELSVDRDSVAVEIPITQKRYEGKDYRAYISGYETRLDSIFVFPPSTLIRERTTKPPNRWSIGVNAGGGYGLFHGKPDVYVGIGVSFRLW